VRSVLQNGCQVAALCGFELFLPPFGRATEISEKRSPSSFHVPSPTPPPALAALPPRPHLPRIAVDAVRIAATESPDSAFTRPPPRGAAGWGLAVEGVLVAGDGGECRKRVDEERDGRRVGMPWRNCC